MIAQIIPTNWHEREKLRNKGQFWTPVWLAEAMIEYVAKESDLIFDPATGKGAFFDALLQLEKDNVSFYGIDVDEEILKAPAYSDKSCLVEKRDFLKNPPPRKFKAIVSNPPYIRHHRIDEATKIWLKQLTRQITGFTIDGRAGYHIYFLLQALDALADGGRLAIVLPADSCEGIFADKLWRWIGEKFCVECVLSFDENAAPFPKLDTNAIVFFIRKVQPQQNLIWAKLDEINGKELKDFIISNFALTDNFQSLQAAERNLDEALKTGLSRPKIETPTSKYKLSDFATVMRGVATGANEFFFLTRQQAKDLQIPEEFLKLTVGRTRDVTSGTLTQADMRKLDESSRPTLLLSIDKPFAELPRQVIAYLEKGIESGVSERVLVGLRNPWYKAEKRAIPEMLFAYLGRRNLRFIKNDAGVIPLHCLHCVYTRSKAETQIENLWQVLNHPDTLANLQFVSKSYGSGALKAEPQKLKNLAIPDYLIEKYKLEIKRVDVQLNFFEMQNA